MIAAIETRFPRRDPNARRFSFSDMRPEYPHTNADDLAEPYRGEARCCGNCRKCVNKCCSQPPGTGPAMTMREAAQKLGLSFDVVRALIRRGCFVMRPNKEGHLMIDRACFCRPSADDIKIAKATAEGDNPPPPGYVGTMGAALLLKCSYSKVLRYKNAGLLAGEVVDGRGKTIFKIADVQAFEGVEAPDLSGYYTTEDVCKRLKVSQPTVRQWRREGRLGVPVGHDGAFYYVKEDVDSFERPARKQRGTFFRRKKETK